MNSSRKSSGGRITRTLADVLISDTPTAPGYHGNSRGIKPGSLTEATKDFDEHLSPGLGTIDWSACITALWEIGYDRTLSFESSFPTGSPVDSYRFSAIFWHAAEETAMRRLNYNKKGI